MSSTPAAAVHAGHAEHHEPGFIRKYIFSTDHKMIARQFLFLALFMMPIGGLVAKLLGWARALPETAHPFFHWAPPPYIYAGATPPHTLNSMITTHATLMISFAVMSIPI